MISKRIVRVMTLVPGVDWVTPVSIELKYFFIVMIF